MSKIYPPLQLLKDISSLYPKAWEQFEILRSSKDELGGWPDWCWCPMSGAFAVLTNGAPNGVAQQMYLNTGISSDLAPLAALAPWRQSKEVYCFDCDMEEMLYNQAEDIKIPSQVLYSFPYYCLYIETNQLYFCSTKSNGFFTHMEYDVNNHDIELRLLFLFDEGKTTLPVIVHIFKNGTINDGIEKTNWEAVSNGAPVEILRQGGPFAMDKKAIKDMACKALQLILYICANNADIKENPAQRRITRRTALIKDRFAEIRKWDVGTIIGNNLRTKEKATFKHNTPRPYIRRGHWHHFWTGSKDGIRKLILHWVAPTFVK